MQQRDAAAVPQAFAFRPDDNSPFIQHLTHSNLLCLQAFTCMAILYHKSTNRL